MLEVLAFSEFANSIFEHLEGGLFELNIGKGYLFKKIPKLRFTICKN